MKILVSFVFIFVFAFLVALKSQPLAQQNASNKISTSQQARIDLVGASKNQLSKGGIEANVIGENKDILIMKSTTLSNYKMTEALKDSLEEFRKAGFSKIELTDSTGEKQNINLEALDSK